MKSPRNTKQLRSADCEVRNGELSSLSRIWHSALRRLPAFFLFSVVLGFVGYICGFKLMDMDFWWHIKTGEIMLDTKGIVRTEPFSFTRPGQPYLPTYEWLSQLVLYFVYALGGSTGAILFRTGMIFLAVAFLLQINTKRLWPNILLAIFAADGIRRGAMVRPQLFTYVLLSVFIFLAIRYLESNQKPGGIAKQIKWRIIAIWVGLQVLWVNFHGAASLLGIAVVGSVFCQELFNTLSQHVSSSRRRPGSSPHLMMVPWIPAFAGMTDCVKVFRLPSFYALIGLVIASFISPNFYDHFTYLFKNNPTTLLISEWQPRPFHAYQKEIGPFWLILLVAILMGRKHLVFSLMICGAIGLASLKAFRHEMLFVLTATGVTIYQLKDSVYFEKPFQWLMQRRTIAFSGFAFIVLVLSSHVRSNYNDFVRLRYLNGYGAFAPAKGAFDFLEKENIQGNGFNSYGIGGYMAFRGYPNRKNYIDGRSADHGVKLMWNTYEAGKKPDVWKQLDDEWNFSYAVIDYDQDKERDHVPYSVHLAKNPNWALVFVDDGAAVYLKRTTEHKKIIDQYQYHLVTPDLLDYKEKWDQFPKSFHDPLKEELNRMVAGSSDHFKASVLLSRIYFAKDDLEQAQQWALQARDLRPEHARAYEVLAGVYIKQEKWAEAGEAYDKSVHYAGDLYPNINYGFIASVFEKANQPFKAWLYARQVKEKKESAPDVKVEEKAKELAKELQQHSWENLIALNDRGVDLAQDGYFEEAKDKFNKALQLDPNYTEALNNLGSVYYEEKNWEKAEAYYRKAIQKKESYADAHFNLARALAKQMKWDEAIDHAVRADELGRNTEKLVTILRQLKEPAS